MSPRSISPETLSRVEEIRNKKEKGPETYFDEAATEEVKAKEREVEKRGLETRGNSGEVSLEVSKGVSGEIGRKATANRKRRQVTG